MSGSQGCLINEPARKPIAQPIPMPRLARREKSSVIRFIPYWSVIITAVVATAAAVIWVIDTIEPPGDPVRMRTIEPCVLADITGRMHSSSDWREADAVVLFLIGLNDKASPQFAPEMRRLAGRFDSQGVLFFGWLWTQASRKSQPRVGRRNWGCRFRPCSTRLRNLPASSTRATSARRRFSTAKGTFSIRGRLTTVPPCRRVLAAACWSRPSCRHSMENRPSPGNSTPAVR